MTWNWRNLISPRLEAETIKTLPAPVFWLLGKPQAGKTSLVRVLTGSPEAIIGNGFQACTKTAQLYDFPDHENCLMRFLDTRGLGESYYDPSEDLNLFQTQAQLLIIVMKAMDHAQAPVLEALHAIREIRPEWPLLVVQTCLHEGYGGAEHILPYPYAATNWLDKVPEDLRRSLQMQRQWFAGMDKVRFVALDFTPVEEGWEPPDYGLEALWEALSALGWEYLRQALRNEDSTARLSRAHPHIVAYSVAAAGFELLPPLAGAAAVAGVQLKMFQAIASLYNKPWDTRYASEIMSVLGLGYGLRMAGRQILKVIPGWGQAVTALYSGAATYALGQVLCRYFERGAHTDEEIQAELQNLYQQQFAQGQSFLRAYLKKSRRA
jgi:uncharacterized protein (DUF697 family)